MTMSPTATKSIRRTSRSSSCCSGERRRSSVVRPLAIRPTCVPEPVATTIPSPLPPDHTHPRIRHRPAIRHAAGHRVRFHAHRFGYGLTGQDAAIQDEAIGPDQAKVGRHHVPDMEQHDVARDEVGGSEIHDATVTPNLGLRCGGVAQGLECTLAAVFGRDVRAHKWNESSQDEQAVTDLSDDRGSNTRSE